MAKGKSLVKQCDEIWSMKIRESTHFTSEYSGKEYDKDSGIYLCVHHLIGKPNYRMRYELLNGICLTLGEHKWIAHHTGRQEDFRKRVKEIKGDDIFDRLDEMYRMSMREKSNIRLIKLYLEG